MKKILSLPLLSAALVFNSGAQAATTLFDSELSANIGLVSQYSFRGITQSDEGPALQGGFDITHSSGLYAGLWASNVDFNDGDEASVEIDLYGGFANTVDKFSYDVGVIYYAYPGADSSLDYDFWEGKLEVGYDFDLFYATAGLNYSPDYFAGSGDALYSSLGVEIPLPKDFILSGHVGYQAIDDNSAFGTDDYMDWSVGLGYTYEGFDLSLQYVDTDLDEPGDCADGCDAKILFGISRSF